jgi:predicted acyl esterase
MPIPKPTPGAVVTVHDLPNMILEKNVDIPLRDGKGLLRGNIYKPKAQGRYPVLVTCELPDAQNSV